jgi:hypothetical protein
VPARAASARLAPVTVSLKKRSIGSPLRFSRTYGVSATEPSKPGVERMSIIISSTRRSESRSPFPPTDRRQSLSSSGSAFAGRASDILQ